MWIARGLKFAILITAVADAQSRRPVDREKVHDPSTLVMEGGIPRSLVTGSGVTLVRRAKDGRWLHEARIFSRDQLPEWHRELVPGNRGHLWAPDVIRLGDQYYVYYSVSTFGRNTSAIGLVVGKTLDPDSADWGWSDRGVVVCSREKDRFNAIDPAMILTKDKRLFMSFGSFWDGIYLIELDAKTGLRKNPPEAPVRLAWAPEIEAPFIHEGKDGWFYLFVNWGKCCRGVESTYEIRVGRSKAINGPYLDREGRDMKEGGGTLVLESEGRHIGPGHASILRRDEQDWLVHHFYDGANRGRSRMRLVRLSWDEQGWPKVTK